MAWLRIRLCSCRRSYRYYVACCESGIGPTVQRTRASKHSLFSVSPAPRMSASPTSPDMSWPDDRIPAGDTIAHASPTQVRFFHRCRGYACPNIKMVCPNASGAVQPPSSVAVRCVRSKRDHHFGRQVSRGPNIQYLPSSVRPTATVTQHLDTKTTNICMYGLEQRFGSARLAASSL